MAGASFALSGFVVTHFTYAGMIQAASWLPWGGVAILGITEAGVTMRARVSAMAGWAAVVGMILTAGHPQVAAIGLLGCGWVYIVYSRGMVQRALVGGGLVLGVLAALPQLLASLELSSHSARTGGVDDGFASMGALPPQELLNIVMPHFWGWERPADIALTYVHKGALYFGTGENHWENAFYMGIPILLLAIWGLFQRANRGWVVLAGLSLLLMLGDLTPLYSVIRALPGFEYFRFPARFSLLVTFAIVVLAASGLDNLLDRGPGKSERIYRRAIYGAVAILIIVATSAWFFLGSKGESLVFRLAGPDPEPDFVVRVESLVNGLIESTTPWGVSVLWPSLLALGTILIISIRRVRVTPARSGQLMLLLVLLDLSWFGADYNPSTPIDEINEVSRTARIVSAEGGLYRTATVDRVQSPELDSELLSASLGIVWGVNDVIVLSPLLMPRNERLLAAAGLDVGMDHGPNKADDLFENFSISERMGVRWFTSVHRLTHPSLELVSNEDGVRLYRNPHAPERAYFSSCVARVADLDQAFETLIAEDDLSLVVVESDVNSEPESNCTGEASVEITNFEAHEVSISVNADRAGVLVLADTWYPGWAASLDGEPVDIMRADVAFRGIEVPAGEHTVVFSYEPFWAGTLRWAGVSWAFIFMMLIAPVSYVRGSSMGGEN